MPELRKDPVITRWVIISAHRARRPQTCPSPEEKVPRDLEEIRKRCPFCKGNEHMTPPEILAYRDGGGTANSPNWHIRTIPNKFPALMIEGDLNKEGVGIYDKMNGVGAHEVIIETSDHAKQLVDLSAGEIEEVFWAYRDRIMDLRKDERLKYVLVFKNHGKEAGASLEHSHSQLVALPIVPELVVEEMQGAKKYYDYKERCVFCDIIKQEIADGKRIVLENDDFVAISPFAPRAPFEMWVLPKNHDSCFEDAQKHEFVSLSRIFSELLKKMTKLLDNPAYNFILHNSPLKDRNTTYYHWHFEIMPKLTRIAGFEWGSGFFINPTPPEEAAKYLREVEL